MGRSKPPEERFWGRVDRSGEHWLWTGGFSGGGYGAAYGPDGRQTTAHRVAYILTYGPVPDDKVVRHRCDTPACVRPDHLLLGTQLDNIHDMIKRGRQATGIRLNHRPQTGALNHNCRVPDEMVVEIRRLHDEEGWCQAEIAKKFGIPRANVWVIVKRKSRNDI